MSGNASYRQRKKKRKFNEIDYISCTYDYDGFRKVPGLDLNIALSDINIFGDRSNIEDEAKLKGIISWNRDKEVPFISRIEIIIILYKGSTSLHFREKHLGRLYSAAILTELDVDIFKGELKYITPNFTIVLRFDREVGLLYNISQSAITPEGKKLILIKEGKLLSGIQAGILERLLHLKGQEFIKDGKKYHETTSTE